MASQQISEKQLPYRGKLCRAKFFVGQNIPHLAVIFLLRKFLLRYEKVIYEKTITSITKPRKFSKIFVIYKIHYDRI